ncbi:DUF4395 domain-containing protein [Myceligenerans crystallogenes]|uniref:DUF4395 domain-containing protein n=1 Tax=Myceligenerans crystallogenes TaxID=316335 RepID=A0ABP4ZXI9_9MICO
MTAAEPTPKTPGSIDPRGPRVGAGITAVLLAVVIALGGTPAGLILLTIVALSFLLGTIRGAEGTWQGWVYRTLVRPRLGAPAELEDRRPPRFAQLIGLIVAAVGVVLGVAGLLTAVPIAAAVALIAALLNAVFGLCLGCELYLVLRRWSVIRAA